MEHRVGRTVRVFLLVLAVAGFHRLTVVPLVEPRLRDPQESLDISPEQAAAIRGRADRRLAALGDLFPAGAWEREDPIMLESRQMRLLFKQYQVLPDGRVNLVPCTMVLLPDRNRVAAGQAGRTLMLRAPQGAVLEFDEPLDLRQGRLARLVGGSLRGQVTIRGTPSAAGADDDIEIVTRDVELDEFEVRTGEMLQFRYGRSTGSGRGLVARLLPKAGGSDRGPGIGGVDTIRLDRDVQLRIEGMEAGLLPGRGAAPDGPAGPVNVSCRGSLCMNVSAGVITLEDRVEVTRALAGGGAEDLTGDLLAIVLRRDEDAGGGGSRHGGLEAREIQAKGTPVVVRSTAAGLEARAARLGYEIASRRILLDGDEPVSLVARDTEVEAKSIDYAPAADDGPGALMAVGPGWLRTRPAGGPPTVARWQKWLRMRPDGADHVASIAGDAEVAVEGQGRLGAAEMHLWLAVAAEPRGAAPRAAVPGAGPDLSGVRPLRLLARGMVEMEADELAARTDRMEVWFRAAADADAGGQPVGGGPAAGAAPAGMAAQAVPGRPAAPAMRPPAGRSGNRIVATAALIRGLVGMNGREAQLDEMSLEGQVHVVEEQGARRRDAAADAAVAADRRGEEPPAARAAGMEIRGEQLQISRPTRTDARAIVSGRPASVRGRGLDLTGPLVDFDRGRNTLGVDGAGRLEVPLAAGAAGFASLGVAGEARPLPAADGRPATLDVTWQGRMDFDGQTARFVDRVVTVGGDTTVRAGSLDVLFNRPIEFAVGRPQQQAQPDVSRIACGGGVKVESRSAAQDGGQSVERLFSRDLVIDRASGDVTATGPGRFASTRFGQAAALAPPVAPGGAAPAAAPPAAAPRPDELTYLGVDFQRGMRGNVHRRVMEFHQRVEAIWGPVARWEDSLDVHAAGGLPPRVVAITADVLGVGQAAPAPGRRRSTIELAAGGNVLVEGEAFTARSARLSYSEVKDLLVFEGDGRSDAQLFRQERVGGNTSSASAGKILFWRSRNHFEVEDARFLDLDQLGKAGKGLAAPAGLGAPAAKPVSRPLPGT